MYAKYFFHIVDREFDDEYDFTAWFEDHDEADRFITENEHAGNTVIMTRMFITVAEYGD